MIDDTGGPSPSVIYLDEYFHKKYPHKYEKSRAKRHRSEADNVSVRHLDYLTVPLILHLKILSGGIIEAAASLIKRLVNTIPAIH